MPPKRIPSLSDTVRERRPQAVTEPAQVPPQAETILGMALGRLFGERSDPLVQFLNQLSPDFSDPESALADIGSLTGPIGGVSTPVRKAARIWLSRYKPTSGSASPWEEARALTQLGESVPIAGAPGKRTGMASKALEKDKPMVVRSQAYTNPLTASLLRLTGKTPAKAKQIAGAVPIHETGHGLFLTHFPFLRTKGAAGLGVEELLASMLESFRTGNMEGILGSFNSAMKQVIKDPDQWNQIATLAARQPRQALSRVMDIAKLSPKQKEAILSAPWVRNYDEVMESLARRRSSSQRPSR